MTHPMRSGNEVMHTSANSWTCTALYGAISLVSWVGYMCAIRPCPAFRLESTVTWIVCSPTSNTGRWRGEIAQATKDIAPTHVDELFKSMVVVCPRTLCYCFLVRSYRRWSATKIKVFGNSFTIMHVEL